MPIDWACNDKPLWNPVLGSVKTYYEDQASSKQAGSVLGTFLQGLKLKDGQKRFLKGLQFSDDVDKIKKGVTDDEFDFEVMRV